jgi:uncharacterized protein (DUF849 family)
MVVFGVDIDHFRDATAVVHHTNWSVVAIGKHVIAQDALAGGGVGVGIDEPAQFGIIITGLEVVERSFGVLELVARPIFSFLSPKKSRRFFGGCCCLSSLYDIQFTVIDYRRPSVFLF